MDVKRKVVLRADAGFSTGMGHFIRPLALAEMIGSDFFCVYATCKPTEYQKKEVYKVCKTLIELPNDNSHFQAFLRVLEGSEIVVLDNYYFTTGYQKQIKAKGCKLVCIDDMHDKHYMADLVINHALLSQDLFSISSYTQIRLGFDYALLRHNFYSSSKSKITTQLKHILICIGGADFNNLTNRFLRDVSKIDSINEVSVIIGDAFNHQEELANTINHFRKHKSLNLFQSVEPDQIVKLFIKADIAILPASTILYEAISQNIPVITGAYINNQIEIARSLEGKFSNVFVVRDLNNLIINDELFKKFLNDLNSIKKDNIKIIDGNSPLRIKKEFSSLEKEFSIIIRNTDFGDIDTYFIWANDDDVRNNAINKNNIEYRNHIRWFTHKLEDKNSKLFIFEKDTHLIGQVRFDIKYKNIIIDYSIDRHQRGKGYGKIILKLAMEHLLNQINPDQFDQFIGLVNEKNISSQIVFNNLNYTRNDDVLQFDEVFRVYSKNVSI